MSSLLRGSGWHSHGSTLWLIAAIFLLATPRRIVGQAVHDADKATAGDANARPAVAGEQAVQTPDKEQAAPGTTPSGPIHIVPYGWPKTSPKAPSKPSGRLSNNGIVQYWGGPVISNVHVVEVLWGNFVDTASTTGLEQFFTDITQSSYFDLLAEYSTVNLTGFGGSGGTNQTIGLGFFDGPRVTINPSVCPGSAANTPCTITDAQIQNEILSQLNAQRLPTPVQDLQGNFDTVYMIYFPPGVTINLGRGVNSCQRGGFCAYHSNVNVSQQPKLPYGVVPDFSPASGCGPAKGCGNGTSFQNLTSASSHELGEAVTDVDVGTANAFAPPLAWADQATGEEIGDFCAGNDVQITVNSNTYTVQTLLSNMQGGCVSAPAHFQVQPSTANAVPGIRFQLTVTGQSSNFGSTLPGYNNTVHFASPTGAAPLPPDYTFVPNTDNGSHTFTLALNTIGNQTITVNDTLITAMAGTASVDIEHNPDMVVASTHSGSFTQSQTGAIYTLTASNIGDLPTNGSQVTVTENLPFGLTATALSGTGWSCVDPTKTFPYTCTRSDALAAGKSYPPITLTVNVANFAPPTVTNNVSVSGGGELNTSNDSGTDPTTIIQEPDLTVSKSHVGVFSQGQLGETYTLTVSNVGFAPTSGMVTLVDQLPTGLTATAISGTGWSCTLGSLTCTRSDSLTNGSSYPPITLTVNVAANAPPSVTNTAKVSGGGEINTSNDTANDVTTITGPAPDLVIAKTHNGNFTQGQTGATYTLTVSNIGPQATDGSVVTVTDTLPFQFTPTSISGNGWTCSAPPTLSCTRNDVLAGNTTGTISSYPPITLTVNVSATAPTPLQNLAFVSGGGELNTANDSASDSTAVTQLADMTITKFHFGTVAQGMTNLPYTLTVSNSGRGPTTGTVTVVDSLPAGLTATAMSGPGWNCTLGTLTCMRNDQLSAFGSYPGITLTVNVAMNAPSSVTNTATVSGGGEIILTNDTATDTATVLPPISFTIISGSAGVFAGGIAGFLFSVNSTLPGPVSLNCSAGLPAGTACIFSPPNGVQGNSLINLSVTTSGAALVFDPPLSRDRKPPFDVFMLLLLGLTAVALARHSSRRYARLRLVTSLASLAVFSLVAGCGGGRTPPPPHVPTPPGTYTITVTATNGNTSQAATFTLVVR